MRSSALSFCLLVKPKIVSLPRFCHTAPVNGRALVVNALWNGDIVQKGNEDHDIDCWWPHLFPSPETIDSPQTSPITRLALPFSWTHLGSAFLSMLITHVRSLSLIPSLGTRIT